jgi:hypothetical protein
MELLIELIVWIFKTVFGDPEKTVDTTKLNRRSPLKKDQRGPYNYGDDRGSAPKTLEEILEEARRQAGQRREGGMRPTQTINRPQPPAQPAQPKRLVELESVPSASAPASRAQPGVERPTQSIEWATLPAPKQAPKSPRPSMAPITPLEAQRPAPAPEPVRSRNAPRKQAAPTVFAMPDLLQAIRTAPPADKRDAARQALIMYEVFGPPRSRRPHRPGMRSI